MLFRREKPGPPQSVAAALTPSGVVAHAVLGLGRVTWVGAGSLMRVSFGGLP